MSSREGSASEIEWLIEERRRRVEDIEEQLSSTADEDMATGLKGMMKLLRNEIAELERELDGKAGEDDTEYEITEIDARISEINSQLGFETDPVIRNNLEVSKRYLQMERNGLLIKKTQTVERKDPMELRIEELEKQSDARLRALDDLNAELEKTRKELVHYKALADSPDMRVSCDTTRVTVEARTLSDLRNEAKVQAVNNYNLKTENRELKNQIDMLRRNVQELTKHCRESDSQILVLQSRIQQLVKDSLEKQ